MIYLIAVIQKIIRMIHPQNRSSEQLKSIEMSKRSRRRSESDLLTHEDRYLNKHGEI